MREIVFRGLCVRDPIDSVRVGSWVYGDLEYNRAKDKARIHTYKDSGGYDKFYNVNPYTVGQYTGMVDCAGRRVYEGDVLCIHLGRYEWKGFVEYDDAYGCFVLRQGDGKYNFTSIVPANIELLGNIHDNPELLNNERNP